MPDRPVRSAAGPARRRRGRRRPGRRRARAARCAPPGTPWWGVSGVSAASRDRADAHAARGSACSRCRRSSSGPSWCCSPCRTTRSPTSSRAWPRPGAWQSGPAGRPHVAAATAGGSSSPAVASGAIPLALHPAMTFTGTSLDLSRLADCCFGVTAPGAGAADRARPWSWRWAPSRSWSRRRRARSTTPRWRTARTTWSPSSPRRWSCSGSPASSRPDRVLGAAAVGGPGQRAALRGRRAHRAGRPRRRRHGRRPRRGAHGGRRRRRLGRPTGRWRGPPPTGRWRPAGCGPRPRRHCSAPGRAARRAVPPPRADAARPGHAIGSCRRRGRDPAVEPVVARTSGRARRRALGRWPAPSPW